MTDQEWYDECQNNYEKMAEDLINDGFTRSKRTDIHKEQFTKDDQVLVIVRHFGSSGWHVKEIDKPTKKIFKINKPGGIAYVFYD